MEDERDPDVIPSQYGKKWSNYSRRNFIAPAQASPVRKIFVLFFLIPNECRTLVLISLALREFYSALSALCPLNFNQIFTHTFSDFYFHVSFSLTLFSRCFYVIGWPVIVINRINTTTTIRPTGAIETFVTSPNQTNPIQSTDAISF